MASGDAHGGICHRARLGLSSPSGSLGGLCAARRFPAAHLLPYIVGGALTGLLHRVVFEKK
jgi:hypothetical protein